MTFFRKSIEIIEKLNQLINGIAHEVRQTLPSRKLYIVRQYAPMKDKIIVDIQETVHVGRMLLDRLSLPVIPEYRSDNDLRDHNASQQIDETINTIEDTTDELDSLMSDSSKSEHAPTASLLTTVSTAFGDLKSAATSMFEDWKSVTSSLPEEWHTCASSVGSGDDWKSTDEYYSAEEFLSDGSRRTSAVGSEKSSQLPAIQEIKTTSGSTQTSPLEIGLLKTGPGGRVTKFEETSKTTQLIETKVSRGMAPGTKLVSVSQQTSSEESSRTLGSSSHMKDSSTSYEQYIDQSDGTKVPVIPASITASNSKSPSLGAKEDKNGQSVVMVHPIKQTNGTGPGTTADDRTAAILKEIQNDEELKNDPLLKHINESKEWLQLKILEMDPDLAKLGSTLEEAMEYQRQHEQVLQKLQGKQSPVEELLNQADQLISTQKPRAEVYAAMAESLGLAWRDLNNQLEHRKQLLEQSVAFHLRAKEVG